MLRCQCLPPADHLEQTTTLLYPRRNRSFHADICKSVFDSNVDADCGRSYHRRCNEGIERSIRFQLGYGLDSGLSGTQEAAKAAEADETEKGADKAFNAVVKPRPNKK